MIHVLSHIPNYLNMLIDNEQVGRSSSPKDSRKLNEHASKWREIGTYLGFRPGELDVIQSKPLLLTGAPGSWLSQLLSDWFQWAPGDGRGSTAYATLSALKTAVDRAGLGRTAAELTINFN